MDLYRISSSDLKSSQLKIDNQRNYLSSNSFMTINGELKSYLDISMSANISSRYYAQLVNKVNTLEQIAINENIEPVFLTLTLDGVYHDLMIGKYSRFTLYHQKKLPENDTNGYLQTKVSNREIFTARDLYQILRFQWRSFQNNMTFRQIKIDGFKTAYLFAVEPHESGVPHAHVLLYMPKHFIKPLKDVFIKYFWAKRNCISSPKQLSPTQIKNGEINGYQWTLSNAVGYVMKYCTKSFMDLKHQKEIDELQAWYIKHKIIRITMSHTLVPQWVYSKIYPLESDWLYLSDLRNNSSCEWSQKDDYFEFIDNDKNQVLRYDKGLYQRFINGELREEFGTKKDTIKHSVTIDGIEYFPLVFSTTSENAFKQKAFKKRYPFGKPISNKQNRVKVQHKVKFGYQDYLCIDNNWVMPPIVPSKMQDFELYQYYLQINKNIDTTDLVHFGITQNECIKRGLIDGKIQSLNGFNTNITSEDYTMTKFNEVGILDTKTQPLPNIDKEYFGLPKTDIVLPEDFDYSFTKNEDEVIEKFPQGYFDFDTKTGV